jgi:hypothetical protein
MRHDHRFAEKPVSRFAIDPDIVEEEVVASVEQALERPVRRSFPETVLPKASEDLGEVEPA